MDGADNDREPPIRPDTRDYAIYSLDARGMVTSWNDLCERMKGYAEEEIIGRHFSIFYPADERASGYPDEALSRAAAKDVWVGDGWRVRKDGSQFWAHVVITSQYDAAGELSGFIEITRDDTRPSVGPPTAAD